MTQPVKPSDERMLEQLLDGVRAPALLRAASIVPLSQYLASVDSAEGRKRLAEYLNSIPFPHYEAIPETPGLLVRVDADGTQTIGREFCPLP